MPPERRFEIETALLATGVPGETALYSGVHHGFAVSANLSDPLAKFAKVASFYQLANWIEYWL